MSKDLFMMMREEEVATSNFLPTKKEIQKTSKEFALKLIDEGQVNIYEMFAQSVRIKEAITSIEQELKNKLPDEAFESFGIKGVYRGGGETLNLEEDEIYKALKSDLDKRAELLKLAQNQDVIDGYGNDVPKVSKTPRKSSLAISF